MFCLETTWDILISSFSIFKEIDNLSLYKRLHKLKQINLFKVFSDAKLIAFLRVMKKAVFKNNQVIFNEGDRGDSFYMVHKGSVQVIQQQKIVRELGEGSCFGEIALVLDKPRTATVVSINDTKCFVLKKEDFLQLLDEKNKTQVIKRLKLFDQSVELDDLHFVKFLGKGKYGVCNLVYNGSAFYAVKSVSRKTVDAQKALANYFCRERQILLAVDHVFIVKLVKTLKDEEYIYFLLELINGCSLDDIIDNKEIKKKKTIKFYIGSLVLAVEYLNSNNIAHRDLKPSNIMVDYTVDF